MVYVCRVVAVSTDTLMVLTSGDFSFDSEEAMLAWFAHYEAKQPAVKHGASNGRYEERDHIPSYSRVGMPEGGAT